MFAVVAIAGIIPLALADPFVCERTTSTFSQILQRRTEKMLVIVTVISILARPVLLAFVDLVCVRALPASSTGNICHYPRIAFSMGSICHYQRAD